MPHSFRGVRGSDIGQPRRRRSRGENAWSTTTFGRLRAGHVGDVDDAKKRQQAAVALLTAWLEDADGTSDVAPHLVADLVVELGGAPDPAKVIEGVLALVAGLTSVAGHLLIRSARANGSSEEAQLQSLSLLFA